MIFREMTPADVPMTFLVRTAAKEHPFSLEDLARFGITVESCVRAMATTNKGWVCEINGIVIGFAVGIRSTGEMWVIAVLPEFEGRGIGQKLLTLTQDWLWSQGCETLWLTTSPRPTRVFHLYSKLGWRDSGRRESNGDIRMELPKPL
ncbi:MAG: GNAT family N-acetyltransferase [Verrucomicrobiota bacterium]